MNWNKINIDKCPYYSKDKNSNNIFDRCKKKFKFPGNHKKTLEYEGWDIV